MTPARQVPVVQGGQEPREVALKLGKGVKLNVSLSRGGLLYVHVMTGAPLHKTVAHTSTFLRDFELLRFNESESLIVGDTHFPLPAGGFDKLREMFPELAVKDYRDSIAAEKCRDILQGYHDAAESRGDEHARLAP